MKLCLLDKIGKINEPGTVGEQTTVVRALRAPNTLNGLGRHHLVPTPARA